MNEYEKKLRQAGLHEPATKYLADPNTPERLAAGFPAFALDSNGLSTGQLVGAGGKIALAKMKPVPTSRTLTLDDLEGELSFASGITVTVPNDTTFQIVDPVDGISAATIAFYVAGAVVPIIVTTGLTMRGTAPTMAQYKWYGIKRVGVNEWAWL